MKSIFTLIAGVISLQVCLAAERDTAWGPESNLTEFTITGTVIDADTGEPIKDFVVTPGIPGVAHDLLPWQPDRARHGTDGDYSVKCPILHGAYWYHVKAEALGYCPEMQSGNSKTNPATRNFQLHKGDHFAGIVIDSAGRRRGGASVAFKLIGADLRVDDHRILAPDPLMAGPHLQSSPVVITDGNGEFTIPAVAGILSLVVFETNGFAEVPRQVLKNAQTIRLQPWDAATRQKLSPLKVTMQTPKTVWAEGTAPKLTVAIEGNKQSDILTSTNSQLWRLEVDGTWYTQFPRTGESKWLTTLALWTNSAVILDQCWVDAIADQRDDRAMYGKLSAWWQSGSISNLVLKPGKHTIRLCIFAVESGQETRGTLQSFSNPVEIETVSSGEKLKRKAG